MVFWKKLSDAAQLFFLFFWVKICALGEYCVVVWRYYGNRSFRRADWRLIRTWFLRNPYTVARPYLQSIGSEDVYAYGETSLLALASLVKRCGITADDKVYELGCGRGRSCFWLHCVVGCRVVGIDFVPTFIRVAEYVRAASGLEGIEFRADDITQVDYSSATVVYLYGTGFDRGTLTHLAEAFERLPKGAKVITVSYSMNDYCPRQLYEIEEIFPLRFTWGEAQVFLQRKV